MRLADDGLGHQAAVRTRCKPMVLRNAAEALQAHFDAFDPGTTPAARWARLAEQKLAELCRQIQQAQEMKVILQRGLQCGCLRFEDCVLVDGELCR